MHHRRRWIKFAHVPAVALLAAGIWSMPTLHNAKNKKTIEFNRDVRPVITKCFTCHGHDPNAVMAGLHLDRGELAKTPLKDGKIAIVPFHPEKSELIKRIYATDGSQMPPPSSNKILSADEKDLLKRWIEEGAEYKEHWAFVPPVRYAPPEVRLKSWPKNEIDRFILAKLEENNLKPEPEADRRTLIRRVTLDLIGLPPTPAEVTAFLNDKSPNAYEKVVDRLLASPRYGERMAMDWMDYSRYADSNGYQADWERFQWRWRDWVIDAFNKNMPYDQFTIDQIGGDLLPHPTTDEIVATGFNRNHRINTEGGVVPEEWRVENVIDRTSTFSEVWLGLTAGCARCHDHKYDPLTQKDFYSLGAYFSNIPESGTGVEMPVNHPPVAPAPTPEQSAELAKYETRIEHLQNALATREKSADGEMPAQSWNIKAEAPTPQDGLVGRWILGEHPSVVEGKAPVPKVAGTVQENLGRSTGAVFTSDSGYVDLGSIGDFDKNQKFSWGAWVFPNGDDYGTVFSRMDSSKNYRGWDFSIIGQKVAVHIIHDWPKDAVKVLSEDQLPVRQWSHVMCVYDGSGKAAGVSIYINGKKVKTKPDVDSLTGSIKTGVNVRIGRRVDSDFFNGRVDDPVLYSRALTADEVAKIADVDPAKQILKVPPAQRTYSEKEELSHLWAMRTDPVYRADYDVLQITQKEHDNLKAKIPTVMVMKEMSQPRNAYVLVRGLYDHHGPRVTMATPAFLPPLLKGAPNNRLGLAEWIVSPKNPLTSRVTVNRMWQRLFGTGIVATVDDFGTRAEYPSHPELLDWLATEFIRLKWNQKAMWKEMVMSATYRQSSVISPEKLKIDPENRLLARGPRFRLPGEVIRDQAMQVSGLIYEKIGGPSVYPYQPEGTWDEMNVYGNLRNYKHATDANLHRRSLYTIWKRTAAPPNMLLFDVPSREVCVMLRARTDTPLQALDLMNDVTYLEAARALAQNMIKQSPDVNKRLDYAFEEVLSREPTQQESSILKNGLTKMLDLYKREPAKAKELISQGDLKNDPKLDPAEIAAYTVAASTLLNLDETINKE